MRKIFVIGIGAGNPDYMTIQAINALNETDVIFIPDKGAEKSALRKLRTDICERFIKHENFRTVEFETPKRIGSESSAMTYRAGVDDWHGRLADRYEALLMEELSESERGAFLVWGDPSLFDSTLRILDKIRTKGATFDYEVIPGISAVQALAARHRIALNRIGEPVLITTGRKLAGGFPNEVDDVVVMLDGEHAFKRVAGDDVDIYWGAYLGTRDEVLISGKLTEVMGEIERVRYEKREKNGWIMDSYLLRRRSGT